MVPSTSDLNNSTEDISAPMPLGAYDKVGNEPYNNNSSSANDRSVAELEDVLSGVHLDSSPTDLNANTIAFNGSSGGGREGNNVHADPWGNSISPSGKAPSTNSGTFSVAADGVGIATSPYAVPGSHTSPIRGDNQYQQQSRLLFAQGEDFSSEIAHLSHQQRPSHTTTSPHIQRPSPSHLTQYEQQGLFRTNSGATLGSAGSPSSVNAALQQRGSGGDDGVGVLHKTNDRSTLISPPTASMTESSSSSRSGSPRDGLVVGNNSSARNVNTYHNNNPVIIEQRIDHATGFYQSKFDGHRDFTSSSPTGGDFRGSAHHYQVQHLPRQREQQQRNDYHHSQQAHHVQHINFNHQQPQQQQQVLYIAAPSPDGRGQVLQPVQMVQVQGQPAATIVVPSGTTLPTISTSGGGHNPPQLMVIPSTTSSQPVVEHNRGVISSSTDNRNHGRYAVEDSRNPKWVQELQHGRQYRHQNDYEGSGNKATHTERYGSVGSWAPTQAPMPTSGREDRRSNPPSPSYSTGGSKESRQSDVLASRDPNDIVASLYSAPQRPPLSALVGHIRRLSRDQLGCRLLQQALDEEGQKAATLILNEGLSFWGEAMVDPFGNYLFQKILEKITLEERIMVVKTVSSRLINASLNLHGTRSVQKLVELCAADELATRSSEQTTPSAEESVSGASILTQALAPAAARLCIDSHGNHVIQRILLQLGSTHSRFVFDEVAASVSDVARHRHGCCVIQRCLDSPPSEARSHLVQRIVDNSLELMQDAYGNYVVQYVLDVCSDDDVHAVCESVVGKVCLLAIQKFSSNVMEKCLERCAEPTKAHYLDELSNQDRIRELMVDPFGNYVVQRALSVATHAQAVRLVEAMRPHLLSPEPEMVHGQRYVGCMRNTAGGRRIMAKICRRFPNFSLTAVASPEYLYCQHKVNIPSSNTAGNPVLPMPH